VTAHGKRRLPKGLIGGLLGLLAVASACYPSAVDQTSDLNTVTTVYDPAFSSSGGFQSLTTYSMPGATLGSPTDCVIEDLADGGPFPFPMGSALPATICGTIESELDGLGYVLVDAATTPGQSPPDFIVTVGGLQQSYTVYVSYPWYTYWGGYYPDYPWGGWGIYFPWSGFSYSYQIGTLVLVMVKPTLDAGLPGGGEMAAIWSGALNGVITQANTQPDVISSGITQAFRQSPYLGKQ
jgi:hypothetical protein